MLSQTKVFPDRRNLKVLQSMKLPHVTGVLLLHKHYFYKVKRFKVHYLKILKQMLLNKIQNPG